MGLLAKIPRSNSWPQVLHSHHHSILIRNSWSTAAKVNTLISTKTYFIAVHRFWLHHLCNLVWMLDGCGHQIDSCSDIFASIKVVLFPFKVLVLVLQEKEEDCWCECQESKPGVCIKPKNTESYSPMSPWQKSMASMSLGVAAQALLTAEHGLPTRIKLNSWGWKTAKGTRIQNVRVYL
jgi:hypothetical protein